MKSKKYARKILKYLIEGRPNKIKKYIKKKKIDFTDFVFRDGDSLLHKFSYYGFLSLIKKYVKDRSVFMKLNPSNGKLPCHQAILGAMHRIKDAEDHLSSSKTILFLRQANPASFKIPDVLGVSADFMFKLYKTQCKNYRKPRVKLKNSTRGKEGYDVFDDDTDDDDDEADNDNIDFDTDTDSDIADYDNDRWNSRMDEEFQFDPTNYLNSFSEHLEPDTWSKWADGIWKQYHTKHGSSQPHHPSRHHNSSHPPHPSQSQQSTLPESHKSSEQPYYPRISPERIERFNDQIQRNFEEEERKMACITLLQYEQICERFFSNVSSLDVPVSFKDIPWPFPLGGGVRDVKKFIFNHLEETSAEFQRVLRRNQVRWHPDRFMHRCAGKLVCEDEVGIVHTVKELSQFFNGLSNDHV